MVLLTRCGGKGWWERMVVVGKDGGGCEGWWMVVVVMEKDGVSGSDGRSGDHRQILLTIYFYLSEYYY